MLSFAKKKMKILLIGSSSDIARNLVENANYEFEFIELTSTPTSANQHQIDVQNEESYPQIDVEINGIVYFPGSINLRPFSSLKLSDFQKDYEINVLGLIKTLKHYHKQLATDSSIVLISSVAASVGMPYHASISMCKSAIEGLCRSLLPSGHLRLELIALHHLLYKLSYLLVCLEPTLKLSK